MESAEQHHISQIEENQGLLMIESKDKFNDDYNDNSIPVSFAQIL